MKIAHTVPVAVSAVMPGLGHLAAGRVARGLLVFFLFGCAVDGYFYSRALRILPAAVAPVAPGTVQTLAIMGGALVWLYAVGDTTALALRRRRLESRADEATAHVREGLIAYLRDDLTAAAHAFHAALRIDNRDPDALYHLGVVYAAAGHRRKARRAFERCIRFDDQGKWDTEAHDRLHALDTAPSTGPEPESRKEAAGEAAP
ncbi:MAG: tetratricopeptide repeat protein [Planctomycetota bacterium]